MEARELLLLVLQAGILVLLIALHLLLVTLAIVAGAVTPLVGLLLLGQLFGRSLRLQAGCIDRVLGLAGADLVGGLRLLVQRVLVLLGLERGKSTIGRLLLSVY